MISSVTGGMVSRDLAKFLEEFVFAVGVGDDLVMRIGIDSVEDLRSNMLHVLHACRLPKVSIHWSVPRASERELLKVWRCWASGKVDGKSGLKLEKRIRKLNCEASLVNCWVKSVLIKCRVRSYVAHLLLCQNEEEKTCPSVLHRGLPKFAGTVGPRMSHLRFKYGVIKKCFRSKNA